MAILPPILTKQRLEWGQEKGKKGLGSQQHLMLLGVDVQGMIMEFI